MSIITFIGMFISVICASLSQAKRYSLADYKQNSKETAKEYVKFRSFWFWISFLILAAICFISASGNDIVVYVDRFENWGWDKLLEISVEPGYTLLTLLIHVFVKNGYIGIGIIKLISIFLIYKAIYIVKDHVSAGMSVLAYCCLLYIYNFQLLRMMLAVGIVFCGLSYEIVGQKTKAVILICIAPLFHYSSLFLVITFLGYYILKRKMTTGKMFFVLFTLGIIVIFSSQIVNIMVDNIPIFHKYMIYTKGETNDIGIGQFLLFIPIAWILWSYCRYEKKDQAYCLSFLLGIMTFFIGSLGYNFPVISRGNYYFYYFFVYYVASVPRKKAGNIVLKTEGFRFNAQALVMGSYLLFMLFWYIYTGGLVRGGLTDISYIWEYI